MRPLVGLVVLLVACSDGGYIPRLTFPQYEQAKQTVQNGIGKRYEDYNACRRTATDAKALVACMDTAGYDYVRRSADEQATECWRLRDANSSDPPLDSWCFLHRDVTQP